MFTILTLLALLAPQKPPQAPAPPKAVDRPQPKDWKPYTRPGIEPAKAMTYHRDQGHRFKYGYYFEGHRHPHWSRAYYDTRWGCFVYHDPGLLTWFWWCGAHGRFYPLNYIPEGCRPDADWEAEPKKPDKPPPAPPPYSDK